MGCLLGDADYGEAFHLQMLRIDEEAKGFGYYPTYFLSDGEVNGGVSAAKELLHGSQLSGWVCGVCGKKAAA